MLFGGSVKDVIDRLVFTYEIINDIEKILEDSETKEQLLKAARIERKKALEDYINLGKD